MIAMGKIEWAHALAGGSLCAERKTLWRESDTVPEEVNPSDK